MKTRFCQSICPRYVWSVTEGSTVVADDAQSCVLLAYHNSTMVFYLIFTQLDLSSLQEFERPLFGTSLGPALRGGEDGNQPISQLLCLPVGVSELLQANTNKGVSRRNLGFLSRAVPIWTGLLSKTWFCSFA